MNPAKATDPYYQRGFLAGLLVAIGFGLYYVGKKSGPQ
jgi:hypothetical protein